MTKTLQAQLPSDESLQQRAKALGLYGMLARWSEFKGQPWIEHFFECEEEERRRRSLERRIRNGKIGRFKPTADFDWSWPTRIDRDLLEEVFTLDFLEERANVILIGPNGVGKSTIAQNLAHQAVLKGHTVRFTTASEMLNDLIAQDSAAALARRLRQYIRPRLLVVDEVGYLSYNSRHADLLFEIISKRHHQASTVVTTNRPFTEWNEVFPNSSSVVALIDRLVHKAEIIQIEGESYRLKEAKERAEKRSAASKAGAKPKRSATRRGKRS